MFKKDKDKTKDKKKDEKDKEKKPKVRNFAAFVKISRIRRLCFRFFLALFSGVFANENSFIFIANLISVMLVYISRSAPVLGRCDPHASFWLPYFHGFPLILIFIRIFCSSGST